MSEITTVAEAFAARRASQAEQAGDVSTSDSDASTTTETTEAEPSATADEVETSADSPENAETETKVEADSEDNADEKVEAPADKAPVEDEPTGSKRLQRRLRKKIAALKTAEAENVELKERLASLESKVRSAVEGQDKSGDDWLADLFSKDEPEPKTEQADDDVDPAVADVRDRLHRMEVQAETERLRSELSDVRKDHPSVPAELLLRAVQQDAGVDLHDVAERYEAWIDKQVKARTKTETQVVDDVEDKPEAAKRPKGKASGGGSSTKQTNDKYAGASSVRDLFKIRRDNRSSAP